MTDARSDEEQIVADLAERADRLLDRRAMIKHSTSKLALPILVSICITREAMGQGGSHAGSSWSQGQATPVPTQPVGG